MLKIARGEILRKWSGVTTHLGTFRGTIGCKKCALLAAMLPFHKCFFAHSANQGRANCSIEESFAENQTHQRAAKPVCSINTNTVKKCKFYIKWCIVFANNKFLFDFLVPKNLDSTLLKLCDLILPGVHFSGMHDGLVLRTSLQRIKNHSTMLCYIQKWVVHWSFKFWVFTCCHKLSVEWHWIKFFWIPIFLHFGKFNFYSSHVCATRLVNCTAITEYINI